jgi:malonyl-CoA O-methyltransferase
MSDNSQTVLPPTLDPVASQRWATRVHERSPWLNEEVARRMEDRLQWIRLQPNRWVDWAPLSGGVKNHATVRARYPQALCHVVETSPKRTGYVRQLIQAPWWKRWFSADKLSFEAPALGSAEMLWANMALHTADDPQALLQKWHQLLAVDGFLMFSCLGPDTLRELNRVYESLGWPPACHAFTDMHDWCDMLVQAGFAEPVMDMERLTLTYESPERLLAEFRALGRNLHRQRFAGLRGKNWRKQLETALGQLAKPEADGRLLLTIEVIYGHALKPLPRLKMRGESSVSLQDMKTLLGKSLGGEKVEF